MERHPAPRPDPRNPLSPVKILSVACGTAMYVKFLGNLRGLMTHWYKNRSVPCPGDTECDKTLHRTTKIFKAYAAVLHWKPDLQVWRPAVLEATANLEEYLRGRKLRGEVWLVGREKEAKKTSPVTASYCETVHLPTLQEEFEIEDVLYRLFNVTTLNLGVANPMPKKLLLQDLPDTPPRLPEDLKPEPVPQEDPVEREKMKRLLDEMRQRTFGGGRSSERAPRPAPNANGSAAGDNGNGFAH